jgi:hypothetical protein
MKSRQETTAQKSLLPRKTTKAKEIGRKQAEPKRVLRKGSDKELVKAFGEG